MSPAILPQSFSEKSPMMQRHGLLENTGGASPAAGNAWQLTSHGEELSKQAAIPSPPRRQQGCAMGAPIHNLKKWLENRGAR